MLSDLFGRSRPPVTRRDDAVRRYFDAVRGTYVSALMQGIIELRETTEGELLVEPSMDTDNPRVGRGLPWRADAVEIAPDGASESIRLTGVEYDLTWAPDTYAFPGGLVAQVESFAWDECTIVGTPAPAPEDCAPLAQWFLHWFQQRSPDAQDTHLGVVHSSSRPEIRAGYIEVHVDLGTAPPEALVELLGVFGALGVRDALVYTPERALDPVAPPAAPSELLN